MYVSMRRIADAAYESEDPRSESFRARPRHRGSHVRSSAGQEAEAPAVSGPLWSLQGYNARCKAEREATPTKMSHAETIPLPFPSSGEACS